MMTKDEFLDSCAHETRVIRHLTGKILPGGLDWKPTPVQRTTLELLRYLTSCAIVPARAMVQGSWDGAVETEKASDALPAEEVPAALDRQMEALTALLAPLTDADFIERDAELPWGERVKLGRALVDTALKTLVAYRMQLFLYAKGMGNHSLGPSNCWVGVDRAAPA
jgi:hypothetical protein